MSRLREQRKIIDKALGILPIENPTQNNVKEIQKKNTAAIITDL